MIWIILFFVFAFVVVVHPIQRRISVEGESRLLWCGRFSYDIGIEGYVERDIDFTLSLHPQYLMLQISLWWVTLYVGWSMLGTHADCASDRNANGEYIGPEKTGNRYVKCTGGCGECQPKWHGQPVNSTPVPEYESHEGSASTHIPKGDKC
jgi:hypothetical protein